MVELATKVVAANFKLYPEMTGLTDMKVMEEVVKGVDRDLDITVTARNVDFEFYWEDKCKKQLKNCRKEEHGCSYKQAFIERRIEYILETHKKEESEDELIKELEAARYEVFCLKIQ